MQNKRYSTVFAALLLLPGCVVGCQRGRAANSGPVDQSQSAVRVGGTATTGGGAADQSTALLRFDGRGTENVATGSKIQVTGPAENVSPVSTTNRGITGGTLFWAFAAYLVISKASNILHEYVSARIRARRSS